MLPGSPYPQTALVTCEECGADQLLPANATWFTCPACRATFLIRLCPGCSSPVQLPYVPGRLACRSCGRSYSQPRWDRSPLDAATASRMLGGAERAPDPDHRVVAGTVISAAGIAGLFPGHEAEFEFSSEGVQVWGYVADGRPPLEVAVDHAHVDFVRVGVHVSGGTVVHLRAGYLDVALLVSSVAPNVMSVRLGPVVNRIAAGRSSASGAGDVGAAGAGPALVDQLAKLAELHQAGVLTDAEFEAAKRRLLAG